MDKVTQKVSPELRKDEFFKKRLHGVVWSEMNEPSVFEAKWAEIIDEYGLANNKWFTDIFDMREHWIPAYFRDFPLSGLFKTTSMSESENSVFRREFNNSSNLMEFFMHFYGCLDAQRYGINLACSEDDSCTPLMATSNPIEKHAADIYTLKVFRDVQVEVLAARDNCVLVKTFDDGPRTRYEIHDGEGGVFFVVYDGSDESFVCDCKMFVRIGLVCRHALVVFKCLQVVQIPEKYIVTRWTKYATQLVADASSNDGFDFIEEEKKLNHKLFSEYRVCIGLLQGDIDGKGKFMQTLSDFKDMMKAEKGESSRAAGKTGEFSRFYGSDVPSRTKVGNPAYSRNKGCGTRIKSGKEKAKKLANKPLRNCKTCHELCNHDSRNCPRRNEEDGSA